MRSGLAVHLNVFLAPVAGLVLLLFDSRRMCHADATARRLLLSAVWFTLAAMFCELGYDAAVEYGDGTYRPDDKRTPQEFLSHVDGLMYEQKNERRKNAN